MRKLILAAAVLTLVACDRSKPELEKALAHSEQISAQKDSLLRDVTATSQFLVEMNTEMAKVRSLASNKSKKTGDASADFTMSPSDQRAAVLAKVKDITARLNETESRLAASRKRVSEMALNDSGMVKQLAAFDSTITSFKAIIENQKAELATINEQVLALKGENADLKTNVAALSTDKAQLTTDKEQLTTERNTVYYVVGTKDDLIKKHIIEQTGGMLGIGKTQVPVRELNPADFTAVDKTKVSDIALPKADTPYKIVTRQDVAALAEAPDKKGRIKNNVKIANPDSFWAASKYLIIIEQ